MADASHTKNDNIEDFNDEADLSKLSLNDDDDCDAYYEDDFEEVPVEHLERSECDLGQNKTFSKYRIHEIEHTNAILMKKVLAHSNRPRKVEQAPPKVKTSAEINRRKQQRKIDHDNLILLKKIQSIKPFGLSKNKSYM